MDIIGQIYLTDSLIKKLDMPISTVVKVRVGVKVANSTLVIRNGGLSSYILSPELAEFLNLSSRKQLQIRYDRENEIIHIGPIIGVFTSYLPNQPDFDAKSVQAELIYLSNIGVNMPGQFYIFVPGSINWANMTVRGFIYRKLSREQGIWVSSIFPLPDVVYDRISTRRGEAQIRIKNTKKNLMNLPYLKYFNPSFLNKWRVHQLLISNEDLIPYLPETKSLNIKNLKDMTIRHSTLFLKPCNGSLGNGIIKAMVGKDGSLQYTIYKRGKHTGYAKSSAELLRKTRFTREDRPYIVQQGIDLATYQKSSFDIRIIYQKNVEGEWQISKKFIRVAPRGSSISNLSRGGTAETSKKVLGSLLNGNEEMIESKNEELKNLCHTVAVTLENASQKIYGELGLDIGIDREGNFWLIEVNSKPRKTTETELSKRIVRNTFKRPLQYAIHLAGFDNLK